MELTPILGQRRRQKTNKPAPHTDHLFTCPERGFFLFFSPLHSGCLDLGKIVPEKNPQTPGHVPPDTPSWGAPSRPPRATLSPGERRPGGRDLPCSTAPLPPRGATHRRKQGGQENSVKRKKRERSAQCLAPHGAAALPVPAGDVRDPGELGKAAACRRGGGWEGLRWVIRPGPPPH